MRRTTTPTYIFTFPFNISAIDQMTITFAQGSRKIVKTKADGTILDTKFTLTLAQAETKQFCDGNCKVQIKLASGQTVLASTIFEAKVRSILDDTLFVLPDTEDEQTEEVSTQSVPVSAIEGAEVLIDEIPQEFTVTFTEAVIFRLETELPLDYSDDSEITNKPSINGHEIVGAMSSAELDISASDISVDDSSIYWSAEVDNVQEALDLLAEDTYNAGNNAIEAKALIQDHKTDISVAQSDYSSGKYHVKDEERTAWNGKYSKPSGGIPKSDLASGVQASLDKADSAVQSSDLADYATKQELTTGLSSKYEKPSGGIPSTDMTQAVRTSLGKADSAIQSSDLDDYVSDTDLLGMIDTSIDSSSTDSEIASAKAVYTAVSAKYSKPSGGIPSSDLASGVQTSLGKADSAIQQGDLENALSDYVSYTGLGNMLDLTVDSSSDDDHIPTSKAVYTAIQSAVSTSILTALNTPV